MTDSPITADPIDSPEPTVTADPNELVAVRDPNTGATIHVGRSWIQRWPDDFELVTEGADSDQLPADPEQDAPAAETDGAAQAPSAEKTAVPAKHAAGDVDPYAPAAN